MQEGVKAQTATGTDNTAGEHQGICRLQRTINLNDPRKGKCSNITSLEKLPEKNILLAF